MHMFYIAIKILKHLWTASFGYETTNIQTLFFKGYKKVTKYLNNKNFLL